MNRSNDLAVVFSDGDQCLPLADPLATLFDQIEVHGAAAAEAQYLLRRLTVSLGREGEAGGFETLARSTFGFYQKRLVAPDVAEAWVSERRSTLIAAIQAAAEPAARPWEEELAAKTGGSRRLVIALSKAYGEAPLEAVDASHWLSWLLEQFDPAFDDIEAFLRPDTMARVFGRAYTTQTDGEARRRVGIEGVRAALKSWFAGESLVRIESVITEFIIAHEGAVRRPTRPDPKVKRARRFAMRLAPDLGFLCGLLSQVAVKVAQEHGHGTPPMLQFLPQLVRRGFETPYHFALSRDMRAASRVQIQHAFAELAEQLHRSAADDWARVRDKLAWAKSSSGYAISRPSHRGPERRPPQIRLFPA